MTSVFLFKVKPRPGQDLSCDACTLQIHPGQQAIRINYRRDLTPKKADAKYRTVYYHVRCFRNEPSRRRQVVVR